MPWEPFRLLSLPADVLGYLFGTVLNDWDRLPLCFVCKALYARNKRLSRFWDQGRLYRKAVEYAAYRGHLDLMRWFLNALGCNIGPQAMLAAAHGGQMAVLRWFARTIQWNGEGALSLANTKECCFYAVRGDHTNVLEWLSAKAPEAISNWMEDLLDTAAAFNRPATFNDLYYYPFKRDAPGTVHVNRSVIMLRAEQRGNLALCKMFCEHGYKLAAEDVLVAVLHDQRALLEWMIEEMHVACDHTILAEDFIGKCACSWHTRNPDTLDYLYAHFRTQAAAKLPHYGAI